MVLFICISLVMYGVEHVFICLLFIYVSSLMKCLFRSFAHFKIRLLIFLLLSFNSFLDVWDTIPLSGKSFANIFSQFSVSSFHLLGISFIFLIAEDFKLPRSQTYQLFLSWIVGVVSKKVTDNSRSSRFSPILPSRSFVVYILHLGL